MKKQDETANIDDQLRIIRDGLYNFRDAYLATADALRDTVMSLRGEGTKDE